MWGQGGIVYLVEDEDGTLGGGEMIEKSFKYVSNRPLVIGDEKSKFETL